MARVLTILLLYYIILERCEIISPHSAAQRSNGRLLWSVWSHWSASSSWTRVVGQLHNTNGRRPDTDPTWPDTDCDDCDCDCESKTAQPPLQPITSPARVADGGRSVTFVLHNITTGRQAGRAGGISGQTTGQMRPVPVSVIDDGRQWARLTVQK